MAEILDESPEEEEVPVEEQLEAETPQEEEVPEKFAGKSINDLVKMNLASEAMIGRQAQEVGDLRKTFDDFQRAQLVAAPKEPEEEVDFFTDPEKAMSKAIDAHPRMKQAEDMAQQYQKTTAMTVLQAKHPDAQTVINDEGFKQWIGASKVRTRMYQSADQQYDYESADELLSLWKDRQQLAQQTVKMEGQARSNQVRQGATGSARTSSEPPSRKTYRSSDLIKLQIQDPQRYDALQPELMKAYAEGRVKP